jgi:hypothetical protein
VPTERLRKETRAGVAVWDQVEIPQRRCALWRFSPRSIWVERVENEWHVLSIPDGGSSRGEAALIDRTEKPASSQWRHYLHTVNAPVQPSPVLPDRPVVVKPDRALTLLPGETAQFYVEIPAWFRLSCADERSTRIFEEPICQLSQTWFGDPLTGELCYGLATRLHQGLDSVEPTPHLAVCPLSIANDSVADLAFEKICIHVENLSVFRGPERLWANSLNVVFKGSEQATQIEIVREAPAVEKGLALACTARQPASGWNIRKTFGMLKSFTDF